MAIRRSVPGCRVSREPCERFDDFGPVGVGVGGDLGMLLGDFGVTHQRWGEAAELVKLKAQPSVADR
jgi:hypothetical protein